MGFEFSCKRCNARLVISTSDIGIGMSPTNCPHCNTSWSAPNSEMARQLDNLMKAVEWLGTGMNGAPFWFAMQLQVKDDDKEGEAAK